MSATMATRTLARCRIPRIQPPLQAPFPPRSPHRTLSTSPRLQIRRHPRRWRPFPNPKPSHRPTRPDEHEYADEDEVVPLRDESIPGQEQEIIMGRLYQISTTRDGPIAEWARAEMEYGHLSILFNQTFSDLESWPPDEVRARPQAASSYLDHMLAIHIRYLRALWRRRVRLARLGRDGDDAALVERMSFGPPDRPPVLVALTIPIWYLTKKFIETCFRPRSR